MNRPTRQWSTTSPRHRILASLPSIRPRDLRGRHYLLLDLGGISFAVVAAFILRYDGTAGLERLATFAALAVLPLVVRPFVNIAFGLYQRLWRYASVPDLLQIALAIAAGSAVAMAIGYAILAPLGIASLDGFPTSFWVIEGLLSLTILGGARFMSRFSREYDIARRNGNRDASGVPTLLYGAGDAGATMARATLRQPQAGVTPIGFLDDDETLRGRRVAGLEVLGTLDDLAGVVARTGARRLLITVPSAGGPAIRRVTTAALAQGLEVSTVPSLHELLDGTLDAFRIRAVRVEDLLRRPAIADQPESVESLVRDQVVMITGGGGSIGSELARQVWALRPRRLVLIDRAESPLYSIQRELEARRDNRPGAPELTVHLANVASRAVMRRIIKASQPSVIFHAAAYKHVPMMEAHPSDAVHVNVGGTLTMVEEAASAGIERFVLVSTDKAVEPESVMGATKRIAEWIVADVAAQVGRPYVTVRFGNVLGSAGSVVPLFQDQLERGEALTITHPEMTRYFMTIQEACALILDAASIGRAGDLFVLDMGEPIRIIDLARDLVRLSGRDPDSVPMRITGLRPGEKLTEALFYASESVRRTANPKVMLAESGPPPSGIRGEAQRLLASASGADETGLRDQVFDLVHSDGGPQPAWVDGIGVPVEPDSSELRTSQRRTAVAEPGTLPR